LCSQKTKWSHFIRHAP